MEMRNEAESTRKLDTKLDKLHRVEPLNLHRDVNMMIVESVQNNGQSQKPKEQNISVRSKDILSVKSKYDDFINFLDNVEQEYT